MKHGICPDWVCNHQGIPYDYVYFLTGVIVSIPYLILIRYFYKRFQINLSKKAGYLFLLATPIGYIIYCSIIFFAFLGSKNKILDFIAVVTYAPIITLIVILPISIIGMIIVTFMRFDNIDKK